MVNLSLRCWFSQHQMLFSVEFGIHRWKSHRFLFRTASSKTRVKLVLSLGLAFLITYTSGSNRYDLISLSKLQLCFPVLPSLLLIQVYIIRSSRPVVVCKKGVHTNFANFKRKRLRWSLVLAEVLDLQRLTLSKMKFRHRCFLIISQISHNILFIEPYRELKKQMKIYISIT